MPCRAGITMRPQERRVEWLRECPTMYNWEVFGPFESREGAQAWKDQQRRRARSGAGAEVGVAGARWWGYHFGY